MNEHVGAAIVGLNEAEALGCVEPFNCSGSHVSFSKMRESALPARPPHGLDSIFNDVLGNEAGYGVVNKAERTFECRRYRLLRDFYKSIWLRTLPVTMT
jgi:hypothetical protein